MELQSKSENAVQLARTNTELSKAKKDMIKQLAALALQLKEAKDDAKVARDQVQALKLELAAKSVTPVAGNDKALLEKIQGLEEKKDSLEGALAEWTELAKVICQFRCQCLLHGTDNPSVPTKSTRTFCPCTRRQKSISKRPKRRRCKLLL